MVDSLKPCSWSSLQFQMLKHNVEEESVIAWFFHFSLSLVNQLVCKPEVA